MAKRYRMVRLTEETADLLAAVRAAMQLANMDGRAEHDENELFGVTMDTAVRKLVDEFWRHRQASRSATLAELRAKVEKEMERGIPGDEIRLRF